MLQHFIAHCLMCLSDSRNHCTCEGFELVLQIKRLLAQRRQVHSERRADGKLLNGPADLENLVCHILLGWSWMQKKRESVFGTFIGETDWWVVLELCPTSHVHTKSLMLF